MKLSFLVLFLLFIPFIVLASSIALSPNIIDVTTNNFTSSFILVNQNSQDFNYSISTTSQDIQVQQQTGLIKANENKEIEFTINNLKEDSYIIVNFESSDSINPSISIKLIKTYNKSQNQTEEDFVQTSNLSVAAESDNAHNKGEQKTQDNTLTYILLAIIILLVVIVFSIPRQQKPRTGHTGQLRTSFINKLIH